MQKNLDKIKHKNVLVVGGTGFIGSNLIKKLIKLQANIDSINKTKKQTFTKVRHFLLDISNYEKIKNFFNNKNYDIVFYCSGYSNRLDDEKIYENNFKGIFNLLSAIKNNSKINTKLVLIGSRLEYGKVKYLPVDEKHPIFPLEAYGLEKLVSGIFALNFCRLNNISATLFRVSNVYGPHPFFLYKNYNLINHFIDRAKEGKNLVVYGKGEQLKDYLFIEDLVEALILASVSEKSKGKTYNIGYGKPIKFINFLKIISEKTGVKIIYKKWPKKELSIEPGDYYSDIRKIKKDLNWKPKTLYKKGVEKTLNNKY